MESSGSVPDQMSQRHPHINMSHNVTPCVSGGHCSSAGRKEVEMHLNPPGAELGELEEPTRGFPLNVRNVEKLVGLNGGGMEETQKEGGLHWLLLFWCSPIRVDEFIMEKLRPVK